MERGKDLKIPDAIAFDPVEVFNQTERNKKVFVLSSIYYGYKNNQMHSEVLDSPRETVSRLVQLSLNYGKFKLTVYLQINNFLQIWIFGSKYWSTCNL